jgi:hypothetical protein
VTGIELLNSLYVNGGFYRRAMKVVRGVKFHSTEFGLGLGLGLDLRKEARKPRELA